MSKKSEMKQTANTSHVFPIIRLSIPLIVGQLGIIVQQFADTAMVGRYGTPDLSAAGFVGTVFAFVTFFLLGVSYSTTPVAGVYYSNGDREGVARTLRESLLVNLLVAVGVMLLLAGLYARIEVFRQPEELLPIARPYFLCLLLSVPCMALFNALKQFSDALGQTRLPMWVMLAADALNILLNIPLSFGWQTLGIPAMGLLGAGIATLVSRIFMTALLFAIVFGSKIYRTMVHVPSSVSRRGCMRLLRLGLPISLQLCLESASFNVCGIFMGWIGTVPLAAHQVMCTIATLCFQMVYGVGAAAAIRISHYSGREDWHEVRRVALTAWGISLCCVVLTTGSILLARHPLTRLFTSSAEVEGMVIALMLPFVFYQFGDSLQITFANALRGIARVKTMMFSAFVAYVLVSIPLSYLFAFKLQQGAVGVWWGIPFGLTLAGILFAREFFAAVRSFQGSEKGGRANRCSP